MTNVGLSYDDVLLVPRKGVLSKRAEADLSTELFRGVEIQMPILSANMPSVTEGAMAAEMRRLGGLGVIHRFQPVEAQIVQWKQSGGSAIVSIGVNDGWERFKQLQAEQIDWFCIDVAHGHHQQINNLLTTIKKFNSGYVKVMVGNVATRDAVLDLIERGADAIKVGVGPGAACRTREVTGFGVPQFTAVEDCADVAAEYGIPVVADGGIKNSGDIVKAIAAGASTVMLGKLLAHSNEAAG